MKEDILFIKSVAYDMAKESKNSESVIKGYTSEGVLLDIVKAVQ